MGDDVEFIDVDSENEYQKQGFKEIVISTISTIRRLASKDFYGGYWSTRTKQTGSLMTTEKVYVPSTTMAYINCVDYLSDLLSGRYDKQMKSDEDKINKSIQKIDSKSDNYENELIKEKKKLFRALCNFIERRKWFEVVFD